MKRKLIEVALPLEAINRESAREKSIRHGHPSTLHLWWARRPLAACRAVLFASLVDDPSSLPEEFPTEEAQEKERQRLFGIIERLVEWDNSNNEQVLEEAHREILKSTDGTPPAVLDPFCGGGSIPLEAQRLGLEAHGSDLNPVAVLITKALIEIPPKFANQPPVNPDARTKLTHTAKWKGAQGLADDVRYYGKWMRNEAEKRIGHLYPKVKLENGGGATAIAWLWARTLTCPNPACGATAPLLRSLVVSNKKRKTSVFLVPQIVGHNLRFALTHEYTDTRGSIDRSGARCLACGESIDLAYVRATAREIGLGQQLIATVTEVDGKRVYLPADSEQQDAALCIRAPREVDTLLPEKALGFRVQAYGMVTHAHLFTARQLSAMSTFSDLAIEARERVYAAGGDRAHAEAVGTYLALAVGKAASRNCSLAIWEPGMDRLAGAFGRQAISMTWDFAETNPLAGAGGDIAGTVDSVAEALEKLPASGSASVLQRDARTTTPVACISTDPPYYDNVPYADLSDFFYVWLRRSLKAVYPNEFSTLLTPKAQELIAEPARHDSAEAAAQFFESGLRTVFDAVQRSHLHTFPFTVFYAFKQTESESDWSRASTGWETMLQGLVDAGWIVNGTWPMRTEQASGLRERGRNALASSVVLVCRKRPTHTVATRKELIRSLRAELPSAMRHLQHSNIAAVDLAQAAIGPGMAVFSRYAKVVEADGSPMRVRAALQLINQALDEVLAEQESEYDADTQWAVAWFDQFGMKEAPFGEAETLSKAKNTSVNGLVEAGFLRAAKGKVQLLSRDQLPAEWDPASDSRLTVWEVTQQLIRRLKDGGEGAAADLLRKVGGMGEIARDLAYRLYSVCERKGWAEEAIAYNSLVVAWPDITRLAGESTSISTSDQGSFL